MSTSSNTLWIGDIDSWMDENYVRNIFGNVAPIKSIKVMKKNGQSIGYGFVEFEDYDTASEILKNYNGRLVTEHSKPLKLSRAQFNLTKLGEDEIQVYVCDMDVSVNEDLLKEFFHNEFKSVYSAKIICDNNTRISKGYGFVKFRDSDEANKAVAVMNGKVINGKKIRVK